MKHKPTAEQYATSMHDDDAVAYAPNPTCHVQIVTNEYGVALAGNSREPCSHRSLAIGTLYWHCPYGKPSTRSADRSSVYVWNGPGTGWKLFAASDVERIDHPQQKNLCIFREAGPTFNKSCRWIKKSTGATMRWRTLTAAVAVMVGTGSSLDLRS